MTEPVRDLLGRIVPVHECALRSEMARKMAVVAKLIEGPWQFSLQGGPHVSIAIRYCPFCGQDLNRAGN